MDTLAYLDFDASEDDEGQASFDAMASVGPGQWTALEAEVLRVLAWAHGQFGAPAPLDEGGDWDFHLEGVRELPTPLQLAYRPGAPSLEMREGARGPARITLTLTIVGTGAFSGAFREAFALG